MWLTPEKNSRKAAGERFADLLKEPMILKIPGAHNALAALLARDAGFSALYVSGGAISASMGYADLGIMTLEELSGLVRRIVRASGLPVLVDGDTGYGEALNAMRLVRELEDAGAAAVHIEDQILPKKCGHLSDKTLIPADAMARKVAAAVKARTHLRVVARTDAYAVEGLEGLVDRAKRYLDAGADAIFPEALTCRDDFEAVAKALDCPLLANMTEFGQTPYFSAQQFSQMGYNMVIWPVSSLRIAARAMELFYRELAEEGTAEPQLDKMLPRKRLYELLNYAYYEGLDESIVKSLW